MLEQIDIRCPEPRGKLLMKLWAEGGTVVVSDRFMELACDDCKRKLREQGERVRLVVHRYDMSGRLVNTGVERY